MIILCKLKFFLIKNGGGAFQHRYKDIKVIK